MPNMILFRRSTVSFMVRLTNYFQRQIYRWRVDEILQIQYTYIYRPLIVLFGGNTAR